MQKKTGIKRIKSLTEFNNLSEGQQKRWIRSMQHNSAGPNVAGLIIDKHYDLAITYQQIDGEITIIIPEKFSDIWQKAERETLAEMGIQNMN